MNVQKNPPRLDQNRKAEIGSVPTLLIYHIFRRKSNVRKNVG